MTTHSTWNFYHLSFDIQEKGAAYRAIHDSLIKRMKDVYGLRYEKDEHTVDDNSPIYCIMASKSSYLFHTQESSQGLILSLFDGLTPKLKEKIVYFISSLNKDADGIMNLEADDFIVYQCWKEIFQNRV